MNNDLRDLKKYTLIDLADITGQEQPVVLSWGDEEGLIFSCELYDASLEAWCFDGIDELVKHEIFQYGNKYQILDLHSSVIKEMRRKREARPIFFIVDGYDKADWIGSPPPIINTSNLFVTRNNWLKFVKTQPKLAKELKLNIKRKPGPKDNKQQNIKNDLLDRLAKKDLTIDDLKNYKQESLAEQYKDVASRNTVMAATKAAIKVYEKRSQN